LQGVVTQINHAIGTQGYVSFECKNIVHNYGNLIWENLISGVCSLCHFYNYTFRLDLYDFLAYENSLYK
jgi:hypothetical protein